MEFYFNIKSKNYYFDSNKPINISIRQNFDNTQPNFFNADKAIINNFESNNFIGSTELNYSCNVKTIRINPHCNGTHTESKQHIDHNNINICDASVNYGLLYCKLISVEPIKYDQYKKFIDKNNFENYIPELNNNDKIITKQQLEKLLSLEDINILEAIVIRTLPNYDNKKNIVYNSEINYPFLTTQAIEFLNNSNIKHIIIDTPSLERSYNSNAMSNHKLFWDNNNYKTITEFAYINNNIIDNYYILNLQIPSFGIDCAPSRPILYNIYENNNIKQKV